jgi:PAS domain S-box-containing protein
MNNHREEECPARGSEPATAEFLLLKDRALNVAAEGITIADMRLPEQPLIYVNEGFERLTGYSAESIVGRNCRFLQGEDTDPAVVEKIREALASGSECTVELLNRAKDGRPFWNRLSLTPVRDARGEVTHFIGVQSDITVRKNAEDAVREANRQLEIANSRMKNDLDVAARIQRSLLPENAPQFENVNFSWVFQPCDELAGDTLDIVALDERRCAVYTVDVSGHGVPAALLSVTLSHWFSRLFLGPGDASVSSEQDLPSYFSPAGVAEELNRQFQMNLENAQYFTMCYGVIDTNTREFRYVTAGNPPVLVDRRTGPPEVLEVSGFPIGIVEQPNYTEQVIELNPRDRILLYTDGVVEAENADEKAFGIDGLMEEVMKKDRESLDGRVESIIESVRSWVGSRGFSDDVSILAFELNE